VRLPDEETADQPVNGHIFQILLPNAAIRPAFLTGMKDRGISCTFHYVPLHSAPAGVRFGVVPNGCPITDDASARLVRLPLYYDMTSHDVDFVIDETIAVLKACA
jgi:dTDP-4-amino-4,6-dideoxygalactose transaminase